MDLKPPGTLSYRKTRKPRAPGWARVPGTRTEPKLSLTGYSQPDKYPPLKTDKTTTVPSSMPEKHNFREISQVLPPPWLTSFLPDGS